MRDKPVVVALKVVGLFELRSRHKNPRLRPTKNEKSGSCHSFFVYRPKRPDGA